MTPILTTNRLILRPVTEIDIPAYKKYFCDYEVIRYLSYTVPWPYPDNGVESFLNTFIFPHQGKTRWMWGLFLKNTNTELIGAVDLWREGTPEHRGFWLGRPFWNQGLMTEAVKPVTDFAFEKLNFNKLVFANAVNNIGSRRVKEKTNAKLLRIESARFVDPNLTERQVWELTKNDWQNEKT